MTADAPCSAFRVIISLSILAWLPWSARGAAQVNETTLAALAEGCNGDIRLILGQLQMIRLRARSLAYDDVK